MQEEIRTITDLRVCKSANGFYIGRMCWVKYDDTGILEPYSRDSQEYYPTKEIAMEHLANDTYTPKMYP